MCSGPQKHCSLSLIIDGAAVFHPAVPLLGFRLVGSSMEQKLWRSLSKNIRTPEDNVQIHHPKLVNCVEHHISSAGWHLPLNILCEAVDLEFSSDKALPSSKQIMAWWSVSFVDHKFGLVSRRSESRFLLRTKVCLICAGVPWMFQSGGTSTMCV